MGSEIRPAGAADRAGSVTALALVHAADGYPAHWPTDPEGFLTRRPPLGVWVAVDDTDIVGHVALTGPHQDAPAELVAAAGGRKFAYVSRLFVVPDARGRGLAEELLETAAAAARAAGLAAALNVVADGTAAIRLYERSGWRRLASERAEWTMANGEPALVHYYLAP